MEAVMNITEVMVTAMLAATLSSDSEPTTPAPILTTLFEPTNAAEAVAHETHATDQHDAAHAAITHAIDTHEAATHAAIAHAGDTHGAVAHAVDTHGDTPHGISMGIHHGVEFFDPYGHTLLDLLWLALAVLFFVVGIIALMFYINVKNKRLDLLNNQMPIFREIDLETSGHENLAFVLDFPEARESPDPMTRSKGHHTSTFQYLTVPEVTVTSHY